MGSTWLYLVRHGEQLRAPGDGEDPELGLSPAGQRQAALLGRRLAGLPPAGASPPTAALPFSAVRHSPLRRAAETAAVVSAYLPGVPAAASPWLADRTPVPLPGQEHTVPEHYRWFPDTVPPDERDPGGRRLDQAYEALTATGPADRREVLITHNFVIGWFVRRVMDAPDWRWLGLNQANCALSVIKVSADGPPELIAFNDTGHL
jgi:serine/threonine-protein phosphatase PGAM5